MLKIQESMVDAAHDEAFCLALERGEDPNRAGQEALERLLQPVELEVA